MYRFEKENPMRLVNWIVWTILFSVWLIVATLKFFGKLLFWSSSILFFMVLCLGAFFVGRWVDLSSKEDEWLFRRISWWPKFFGWEIWPVWPLNLFFFYSQRSELSDLYFWLFWCSLTVATSIFYFADNYQQKRN